MNKGDKIVYACCPECGRSSDEVEFECQIESRPTIVFNDGTVELAGHWSWDTVQVECGECGWNGTIDDLEPDGSEMRSKRKEWDADNE